MICTVTLNASIDKAYQLSEPLRRGAVQRVARVINRAGGKGLNCARAVRTLGADVIATGFVGGHNGRMLTELLAEDGIPEAFVRVAGETRCCVNALDPDGCSTELLEPGEPVALADVHALREAVGRLVRGASVVTLNGSLPEGAPTGTYRDLGTDARAAGARVLLDSSGAALLAGLEARPALVKPNAEELAQALGREVATMAEVVEAARELQARGVADVVVSLGSEGAVMASEEGTFRGIAPQIEAVNPVGSGDTMVGAFAVALVRGLSAPERLAFAMACAGANCLSPATGSFDLAVAHRLMDQVTVELVA